MIIDELYLKKLISNVPNYPKKGQIFRDLSPLLADPKALQLVCDLLIHRYIGSPINQIVTVSDSGLLPATILAYRLQKPLVRIRAPEQLPDAAHVESFHNNTGEHQLAISTGALSSEAVVLLVDDAIASGKSMLAAATLVKRFGAQIHEACTLVDLPDEGGRERLEELDVPLYALLTFA